jgi:GTPase
MAGAWLLGAETRDNRDEQPRAVLVAVAPEDRADEGAPGTETSLRELERLAGTDGLSVVETVVQSRDRPDKATYVGSGKAEELAAAGQRVARPVSLSRSRSTSPTPGPTSLWNSSLLGAPG